ncbi:Mov34/MPN/PAD-1 family protein [Lysobacter niastensis]|uniref:Mov34/MPN/PAD-1 family protein n=1 Tax=Lysobacter niastensis TaxID=380629 RepID=A0ABS0B3W5_9GAMM|nr:Mov34/MPN/PAD-1 family protein [Lysobacter niastensis]
MSPEVVRVLTGHRQGPLDSECGGQLFADPRGTGAPVLAVATLPHPRDRAGHTWLELDPMRCETEAAHWQSRGLLRVGVWHTHAEAYPKLSNQDLRSFRAYSRANQFFPVAVIVGQAAAPDGVRAWSIREHESPQAQSPDSCPVGSSGSNLPLD